MKKVINLLRKHENWRKNCLNLIASENVMSPLAKKLYLSDLMHRYAEGEPFKRYYQGTKFFDEIENLLNEAFKKHFKCNFCDLRPLSGAQANLAVFSALAEKGDKVLTLGFEGGSHISHERIGAAGILGLKVYHLPWNLKEINIDLDQAKKQILKLKPKFIVLGASVILFPYPVKELKEVCEKIGTKIVYDAAHVFGLIFSGFFQNPFKEGADIITASTHKTFPGPQGGIILGNLDEELQKKIKRKIFPGLVSNHHLHRLPAVYLTFFEMKKFGRAYSNQIIRNAKALAKALFKEGFSVLGKEKDFTQTHQVLVNVTDFGGGDFVAKTLEKSNIIVNKNMLLGEENPNPIKPSGIRLGVQEMTRYGMKEKEMEKIASLISRAILKKENVKNDVIKLRKKFSKIHFCFSKSHVDL